MTLTHILVNTADAEPTRIPLTLPHLISLSLSLLFTTVRADVTTYADKEKKARYLMMRILLVSFTRRPLSLSLFLSCHSSRLS